MGDSQTPVPAESHPAAVSADETGQPKLFAAPPVEPSNRGRILGFALAAAVAVLAVVLLMPRGSGNAPPVTPNTVLPADPYARNLAFTQLAISQSTSLSGGTSTFIDGHVKNTGPDTLSGVTMQVLFRNDVGLSPQVETLPLTLIRTHEPYVDTEPVSAAPLKPGDESEFRLIIETVSANWNQEMPGLQVVHVAKR
jgi:hypothetical protein